MRIARIVAAFLALGTVAFAVGDFAGHPNGAGALGLIAVIAVFALLLAFLFRPRDRAARRADSPPEPEPRRRGAPASGVWAEGWDAAEAERAKQRRR